MAVTPNLNLYKPDEEDYVSLSRDFNENFEKIDAGVGSNTEAISKILPVISGATNNSGYAISAGEYFEANGKLYKATASIPTGNAWSSSATELSDHGAINVLSSKFVTGSPTIASYSDLQAYLNGIASGMSDANGCAFVAFYNNFTNSDFPSKTYYRGLLQKIEDNNFFNVILSKLMGGGLVGITKSNTTWTINDINSKLQGTGSFTVTAFVDPTGTYATTIFGNFKNRTITLTQVSYGNKDITSTCSLAYLHEYGFVVSTSSTGAQGKVILVKFTVS